MSRIDHVCRSCQIAKVPLLRCEMSFRRHLTLLTLAGLGSVVIAISLLDEPTLLQQDVASTGTPSAEGSNQRASTDRNQSMPEQSETREVSVDIPLEQNDGVADTGREASPAQEAAIAEPIPLEQNALASDDSREVRRQAYERDFANESRDPEWSAGMEGRILAEISQLSGLAAYLIEVDCRTTRCRLQLILPANPTRSLEFANSSANPLQTNLAEAVNLETELVLVMGESGTSVFLTYLRRPETSNPQSTFGSPSSV